MSFNSPCGPDTVVRLIGVGLNIGVVDGIVLVSMLVSRSDIVAIKIDDP